MFQLAYPNVREVIFGVLVDSMIPHLKAVGPYLLKNTSKLMFFKIITVIFTFLELKKVRLSKNMSPNALSVFFENISVPYLQSIDGYFEDFTVISGVGITVLETEIAFENMDQINTFFQLPNINCIDTVVFRIYKKDPTTRIIISNPGYSNFS